MFYFAPQVQKRSLGMLGTSLTPLDPPKNEETKTPGKKTNIWGNV